VSAFSAKNLVILGVSFDTVEENAAFAQKFDFPFTLLCDTDRILGMAYGACEDYEAGNAKRISILIDEEGKVAKIYDPVDAAAHPDQVMADL